VEVAFPAGARVAYETGARESAVAQQIWVRSGTIEVTVGKHTFKLADDDCLAMRLDAPVTFRNRTRRTAHYIVVLAS
jgi:mannose-6-phosphate isomerase-like protein (cupin superfamily)